VAGANLAEVQAVLVSGSGVRVEKEPMGASATACPVKLTIDPSAEPGLREIRLITAKGASNAGRIWVGGYAPVLEKEPNESFSQPQPIEKTPAPFAAGQTRRRTGTTTPSTPGRARRGSSP